MRIYNLLLGAEMDINYIICEACGKKVHVDDMERIGSSDVCNDCIEQDCEARQEAKHMRVLDPYSINEENHFERYNQDGLVDEQAKERQFGA